MKGPIEDLTLIWTFEFNYLGTSENFTSITKLKQYLYNTTYRGRDNCPVVKLFVSVDGNKQLAATLSVPMNEIEKLRQSIELKIEEFRKKRKADAAQHKTFFMEDALRKKMGNKNAGQVISKNGVKLTVVRSAVTDFGKDVLVSLGQSIFGESDREGIVLDPTSELLVKHYDKLKVILKNDNQNDKLTVLVGYLRLIFINHDQDLIKKIAQNNANDELISKEGKLHPLVGIDAFIGGSAGMCRHFAVLGCHLLYRLMKDHLVDCVEVHHVRGMVKSERGLSGHSWIMYKNSRNEWVHLDPTWSTVKVFTPKNYRKLCIKYGESAIDGMLGKLHIDLAPYRRESKSEQKLNL